VEELRAEIRKEIQSAVAELKTEIHREIEVRRSTLIALGVCCVLCSVIERVRVCVNVHEWRVRA
jgi:hypothetical protein